MKPEQICAFLFCTLTTLAAADATLDIPDRMPIVLPEDILFSIDRKGHDFPDLSYYVAKASKDNETLYSPKASRDQGRISVIKNNDGTVAKLIYSNRSDDANLNTVMQFDKDHRLVSQTDCQNNECLTIDPSFCSTLLSQSKLSSMSDLYKSQKNCSQLNSAFKQTVEQTHYPISADQKQQDSLNDLYASQAWKTSNRGLLDALRITGPDPREQNQNTLRQANLENLKTMSFRQIKTIETCLKYDQSGLLKGSRLPISNSGAKGVSAPAAPASGTL